MRKRVEKWKALLFCNGKYEVSTFGRVRSVYSMTKLGKIKMGGSIIKPHINHRGYYIVKFQYLEGGKSIRKTYKIHRLVALAFIPNPGNKTQVNHKDLNQLNNRIENLEWVTAKENTNHAQANGRIPIAEPYVYKNRYQVRYKKVRNKETGQIYDSALSLVEILGMNQKAITRRLSGERRCNIPYEYIEGEYSYVIINREPRVFK